MKFTFEKDIKKVNDLYGLTVEQAREVLLKMGAKFEPIPEVDLGNLALNNIHCPFYVNKRPHFKQKIEKGFTIMLYDELPDWDIDENLIVISMTPEESLRHYAKLVKDEYADLSDEKLLEYTSMGRKRFLRARDECLRRKLIQTVGE